MIRGAIEVVQATRVAGWIYSGSGSLRGHTVLAFVAGRCVGAGEVDGFRKDLLDAELGDGFCGFDFPVRLAADETVGALIVRLQFSDAALLQQDSRVLGSVDAEDGRVRADLGAVPPAGLPWMLDRGMVDQQGYDFIKAVQTVGAYERGLRAPKRSGERSNERPGELAAQRYEPEVLVRELVGLMMLADMQVSRQTLGSLQDIKKSSSDAPVFAVWSEGRGRIGLIPGSHLATKRAKPSLPKGVPAPGTNIPFGPDRLLFIHRDCDFATRGPAPSSGFVVFTASAIRHEAEAETTQTMRVA